MIAGFETPDDGAIRVRGRDLTNVPVHRRDMGMVFQSYALFPHRTVAENVGFGLRMRGVGRREIAERVRAALDLVALSEYGERRPSQLSGGQQQRVALARAVVIRPAVLLCDEPLGALDRKLRQVMQIELKSLQRRLGLTLVFVTHDQEEALAMSDRIGVMNGGRLEQVGSPADIYDRPATRFVAGFIGEITFVEGAMAGGRFVGRDGAILPGPSGPDGAATLALRPEKVTLGPSGSGLTDGTIANASFLGDQVTYDVATPTGEHFLVKERNGGDGRMRQPGSPVSVSWKPEAAVLLKPGP
jgi:putative spermidine/putrescine transport system ATP-binding protein